MQYQTAVPDQSAYITLREHRSTEVAFSKVEVALVQREFASRVDVLPTSVTGIYNLQSQQHIGFIVLPTGRVAEVKTKVGVDILFAMLATAYHLADFGAETKQYTSVADLFESVASFFVAMVEEIVARGILRSFEQMEDELLTLRGKVLVAETLRHRPVVRDRHWCDFTEFTADVLENRILKLTCDQLLPYPYRRIPHVTNRLRRLQRTFAEVKLDFVAPQAFNQIVFHRLNEHYRPALALARLLLSCLSPSGARGSHQFLAFLVNMDTLFEKYVTAVLQEAAFLRTDLQVRSQDEHNLDLVGQVTIRPDVVVCQGDNPCLAVDAKYKLESPNSDIYQALAYCHALNISRAILVYPASEAVALSRHRIQPDGNVEIIILPLDLSGGLDDLNRHSLGIKDAVWREVSGG